MTQVLNYSVKRSTHFRRHLRRYITAAILIVVAWAGLRFGNGPLLQIQILYWQHKCLAFTPSPNVVLRSWKSPEMENLLRSSRDYHRTSGSGNMVVFRPYCWARMEDFYYLQLARTNRFSFSMSEQDQPALLLHALTSPTGHCRLVLIQCRNSNALTLPKDFTFTVVRPATLLAPPHITSNGGAYAYSGRYISIEFEHARLDPGNASHFMIDFISRDNLYIGYSPHPISGIVDGYLNDDDTVSFKLRDPATTQGL